jgi:hypothetical protein
MGIFRQRPTYEEQLRQEAGLDGAPDTNTLRSVGVMAVSSLHETPRGEEEEDEDPEFEAEVAERVREIEEMTVDELLSDGADDLARAELDSEGDDLYYVTRAAAVNSRAVALLLRQQAQQGGAVRSISES